MRKPIIGITLDHDTSPTYSSYPWYALRECYSAAIEKTGGVPVLIPYCHSVIEQYLDIIDGLLIPGGDQDVNPYHYGCQDLHPKTKVYEYRTQFDLKIARLACEKQIPFLGICKGAQVLNVISGGTLIQHIFDYVPDSLKHQQLAPRHETSHFIEIDRDTRLFKIMKTNCIEVNSNHHQSIEKCGQNLQISAKAEDGVIEAIERLSDTFCMGIQWHPEYLTTEYDHLLFKAFVQASQDYHDQ